MTTGDMAAPRDETPDNLLETAPDTSSAEATQTPEELRAQVQKLEGDLRAEKGRGSRGRQTRQNDLENLMLGTNNEVRMIGRRVDALMQAIGTGDTDRLPDELSQIQNQAMQTQVELEYQQFWQTESDALRSAMMDANGNPLLDLQSAPELARVREEWTDAHNRRDRAGLARARAEAQEISRQAERAVNGNARQEGRVEGRESVVNSGAFELDTGPSAAGGGMGDERWFREVYGNSSYSPTPADHKRAKDILDNMEG